MTTTSVLARTAVVASVLAVGDFASSQDMQTYYTVKHPEQFEIDWTGFYEYGNRKTAEIRERLRHHRDLAYGSDAKQNLDLYLPRIAAADAPVFLFLHGGGFQEGDRAHYGFVADSFSRYGIITAVASYRLATDGYHYPAQSEDARNAVAWLYRNVGTYGGDRDAIFVGGHSAGAILAADLGVERSWMAGKRIPMESLKGIVAISGVFDFRSERRPGYIDAYAPTPELREKASPIARLGEPVPQAVVAAGSAEASILASAATFAAELSARGVRSEILILEGENHKDTVLSLADESDPLFRAVIDMVDRARESP